MKIIFVSGKEHEKYHAPYLKVSVDNHCPHAPKHHVVEILEPDSLNPVFIVEKPFGLSGLMQIISAFIQWRENQGFDNSLLTEPVVISDADPADADNN